MPILEGSDSDILRKYHSVFVVGLTDIERSLDSRSPARDSRRETRENEAEVFDNPATLGHIANGELSRPVCTQCAMHDGLRRPADCVSEFSFASETSYVDRISNQKEGRTLAVKTELYDSMQKVRSCCYKLTVQHVPRHGLPSGCGWRRGSPHVEGSWKYIE
jgi:hypothetical protein